MLTYKLRTTYPLLHGSKHGVRIWKTNWTKLNSMTTTVIWLVNLAQCSTHAPLEAERPFLQWHSETETNRKLSGNVFSILVFSCSFLQIWRGWELFPEYLNFQLFIPSLNSAAVLSPDSLPAAVPLAQHASRSCSRYGVLHCSTLTWAEFHLRYFLTQ